MTPDLFPIDKHVVFCDNVVAGPEKVLVFDRFVVGRFESIMFPSLHVASEAESSVVRVSANEEFFDVVGCCYLEGDEDGCYFGIL